MSLQDEDEQALEWNAVLFSVNMPISDLVALCKPGVYIFWQDKVALYVGSSRRLISRMSNPKHESAQRSMRECSRVQLKICRSEQAARELEQHLIWKLNPIYNIQKRVSTSAPMSWR